MILEVSRDVSAHVEGRGTRSVVDRGVGEMLLAFEEGAGTVGSGLEEYAMFSARFHLGLSACGDSGQTAWWMDRSSRSARVKRSQGRAKVRTRIESALFDTLRQICPRVRRLDGSVAIRIPKDALAWSWLGCLYHPFLKVSRAIKSELIHV